MTEVRVRIAPSPSGFLHIGTAKMALFNWLYARQQQGTFILRLEDTDESRTREEFVAGMCEGFRWLGIDWDEGPAFGGEPQKGEYGPYRQSLRGDLYRREAMRLLEEGKAYKCFCTKEKAEDDVGYARYRGTCRNLTPDEIAAKGDAPFALRFKVPKGTTEINDIVQGVVRINNEEFDDFVILRATGQAIFHLAVVVDDGLMKITHVIRGDDHLTNAAKHVMLFNALGYTLPKFAHGPLVVDEHGKKYSKRLHGANVLDWRDDGYLPEALINYVALLGWTSGDDREVFTREELIRDFSLERLGKSAAKFDLKKLQWLNGQHIRKLPVEGLRDRLIPILQRAGFDTTSKSPEWLAHMAAISREKLPTLNDIVPLVDFFFAEPTEYEDKAVHKHWGKQDALDRMEAIRKALEGVAEWNHDALKLAFEQLAAAHGDGLGKFVHPTRLSLTGTSVGPGLFELTELLGRETSLARMDKAIEYVRTMRRSEHE